MRGKYMLMMSEKKVLKRIYHPKRDEVIQVESGEDCMTRNFMVDTPQYIFFG
jgi:hypothetical protein